MKIKHTQVLPLQELLELIAYTMTSRTPTTNKYIIPATLNANICQQGRTPQTSPLLCIAHLFLHFLSRYWDLRPKKPQYHYLKIVFLYLSFINLLTRRQLWLPLQKQLNPLLGYILSKIQLLAMGPLPQVLKTKFTKNLRNKFELSLRLPNYLYLFHLTTFKHLTHKSNGFITLEQFFCPLYHAWRQMGKHVLT